jgi:rRNA maturation RNase YbeY
MFNINVALDPQLDGPNDSKVCSLISHVMDCEGISNANLSLIFGNDKLLSDLKKKFFDLDHYTDVIAFRLNDYDENNVEGEIYISLPRAKENAKKYDQSFQKELGRLIIHGSLHLLGYKDDTKKNELKMRNKEDSYLEQVNWEKLYG